MPTTWEGNPFERGAQHMGNKLITLLLAVMAFVGITWKLGYPAIAVLILILGLFSIGLYLWHSHLPSNTTSEDDKETE